MGATIFIVARGISGGIEKASKVMMPTLYVLFLILVVRVLTLPGAAEGLKYYLTPDLGKLTGATFLMAMGQIFFSLNIGAGCTMTYASILMPFGAFMMCIFAARVLGIDEAIKEAANSGKIRFGFKNAWAFLIKYVVPVIILLVFLSSTGILK